MKEAPSEPSSEGLRLFHCGWLLDGGGSRARRDVVMAVVGGRIVEIFGAENGYRGLKPVDWRTFTVLPALVDAHVHLFLSGRRDSRLRRRQLNPEPKESVIDGMAERVRRHLRRGILAVRDAGDQGALALALRDRFKDRLPSGFVLRVSGRAWHRRGRYGRTFGRCPAPGLSLAEAVAGEVEAIDQVKIIDSGINRLVGAGPPGVPQFDPEDLRGAVAAAHRRHLPVMIHANGPLPVADALAAGCDSVEHGFSMGEDNLARMAERQVVWVPTVGAMAACVRCFAPGSPEAEGARRHLDGQLSQLRRARELGVPVALGTDAGSLGVRHGRGMAVEMELFLAAGYSTGEVVRCGAVNGARLLKLDRSGMLGPGASADWVVAPGAPEALCGGLQRVAAVYCAGRPAVLSD